MIVVSDTSPLNYLILIGEVEVLTRIFGEVYAPPEVLREALHPGSPETVRTWAEKPPSWLKIRQPRAMTEPASELGRGEAEAIALAREIGADLLLMDDRDGTRYARQSGLRVVGTLAVIDEAASRGLLSLPEALERLQRTNFRVSDELLRSLLEGDTERRARRRE